MGIEAVKEEVGGDNTEVPDSTFKLDDARLKLLALVEELNLMFKLQQGKIWLERLDGCKGIEMKEIGVGKVLCKVKEGENTVQKETWKPESQGGFLLAMQDMCHKFL